MVDYILGTSVEVISSGWLSLVKGATTINCRMEISGG